MFLSKNRPSLPLAFQLLIITDQQLLHIHRFRNQDLNIFRWNKLCNDLELLESKTNQFLNLFFQFMVQFYTNYWCAWNKYWYLLCTKWGWSQHRKLECNRFFFSQLLWDNFCFNCSPHKLNFQYHSFSYCLIECLIFCPLNFIFRLVRKRTFYLVFFYLLIWFL